MGCDIHPIIQVRGGNSRSWRTIPPMELSYEKDAAPLQILEHRNYGLFSILAGVRNETVDPFEPIAEPRGLPDDMGPLPADPYALQYEGISTDLYMGDHSFSWVTLEELLAVDWKRKRRMAAMVAEKQYKEWKASKKRCPESWCSWVGGGDTLVVSEKDFRAGNYIPTSRVYISCRIPETYAQAAGQFYTKVLPWMKTLGDPKDVRLVFGFDS